MPGILKVPLKKLPIRSCRNRPTSFLEVLMVPGVAAELRPIDLLVGQKLEYVRLGHAVVLGFTGDIQVVIETVAHLDGSEGRVDIEPGDDPSDAVGELLGDAVLAAWVFESGELQLRFSGGSSLLVTVGQDVESWAVAGPGGYLIVCMGHGELAVWGPAGT